MNYDDRKCLSIFETNQGVRTRFNLFTLLIKFDCCGGVLLIPSIPLLANEANECSVSTHTCIMQSPFRILSIICKYGRGIEAESKGHRLIRF